MSQMTSVKVPEYLLARERARRRDRIIQVVSVICAGVAIFGAGAMLDPLNDIRTDRQLVINPEEVGTLSPDIALMTQTGTLRGLALVAGFIRLEELKQEGKFFELRQLSEWLCKLAPRFASVWQYNAWNQAYNISVCEYTARARWQWVQNGIELLRDEGLKYNPKNIGLYRELAYIYWHKIGGITDDHHWNYKKEMAVDMERVLGHNPPMLTTEEEIGRFRRIAEAPRDVEALIEGDPAVAVYVAKLRQVELRPDATLLEFVARHDRPQQEILRIDAPEPAPERQEVITRKLSVINASETREARGRLLAALRNRELRERFRMKPDWMLTLMERYGPIDWRNNFAHALYWSSYGDMQTRGVLDLDASDSMNTARYIFFALHYMVQQGRYAFEPNFEDPPRSFLNLLPDPRFIDPLHEAYLEIGEEQDGDDPEFREGTSGPRYWVGHVNFLRGAIADLFFMGDQESIARARKYFEYLREYDVDPSTGETKPQYIQPLRSFVWSVIEDDFEIFRAAMQRMGTFLHRGLRELSIGNADGAINYIRLAEEVHRKYQADPATDPNDRRKLEPFPQMLRDAIAQYMVVGADAPLYKSRVWRSLGGGAGDEEAAEEPEATEGEGATRFGQAFNGLRIRQDLYDDLKPYFEEICKRQDPPWDVDKAFPAPPGMEEVRRLRIETQKRHREVSPGTRDFTE